MLDVRLIVFALLFTVSSSTLLTTKLGQIQGFELDTQSGTVAEVFLNIPFAQPPVGELRFEKPVPVSAWSGVSNGTSFGFDCVPHTPKAAVFPTSEDCLTLNVIRPKKQAPPEGFPVLVWVHGGGYEIGSASIYGYKGFADVYTPKDVIVVTIQYRIGWMGFFSTGDANMPGNLGLWDQALAFKFINEHISSFGGNPSKVTAWGLSAGGGSVSQLELSPQSRNYIASTIEMSGSAWVSWAIGERVASASLELAEELGCTENIKSCLKQKSVQEIHEAVHTVDITRDDLAVIKWGPRLDGEFLPDEPSRLLKSADPKPAMIGFSNKDAAFFTSMALSIYIHRLMVPKEELKTFDLAAFKRKLDIVLGDMYGGDKSEVIDRIVEFYVGEKIKYEDFYLDKYTDFVTDIVFSAAAVREINDKKAAGYPVFAYLFEHFNPAIWEKHPVHPGIRGSVHVNEFTYMFDMFILGQWEWAGPEVTVRDLMREAIISFVKTGKPTPSKLEWPEVGADNSYLAIRGEPEIRQNFFKNVTEFYDQLAVDFGFDIITMLPYKAQRDEL